MGGPNGWIVGPYQKQQQDQQNQQNQQNAQSQAALGLNRTRAFSVQQEKLRAQLGISVTPRDTTGGTSGSSSSSQQGGQQQNSDKTQFSFDKNGKAVVQSKDTDHVITVDQQNKKITIKVPTDHKIYVGGDGQTGQYAQLATVKGPVINALGRIG
jgi:hypothetical protein